MKGGSILRPLAFGLAAIEAVILLGFLLQHVLEPPGAAGTGGPQMTLFFFVLLPSLVLAIATALLLLGRASKLANRDHLRFRPSARLACGRRLPEHA